jgi:hypothetical protein
MDSTGHELIKRKTWSSHKKHHNALTTIVPVTHSIPAATQKYQEHD